MENQPEITEVQEEMEVEENQPEITQVQNQLEITQVQGEMEVEENQPEINQVQNQSEITQVQNQLEITQVQEEMEVEENQPEINQVQNQPEITQVQEEMEVEENQPEISQVQEEMEVKENQPKITQVQDEKEEAAAMAEAKALMQIRPQDMPFSSQNVGSLVEIFGLGPLSNSTATLIYDFDREAVISVHNGAQEKFAGLSAGGYFCMTDRPDEFHGVQNPYKRPERMSDLVVVHLRDLAFGEMNDFTVLCGELCVDPFKFGRIYTVVKEADTEDAIALSIVAPNFLSMDQSYAGKNYPKGMKIAIKQPHLVKAEDGFIWLHVDNPWSIGRLEKFPEDRPARFLQWFENGKSAYDAQEWELCVRNYTKCKILISQTKDLFRKDANRKKLFFELHSKRSRAYIGLGRYSKALHDANVCGAINFTYPPKLMMEGVRPKIESFLSLGRYKDAYRFLNNLLFHDGPEEKKSLTEFYRQKCIEYYRVGEAIAGITGRANDCKPDVDFIGPVEIKNSAKGHGKGLFATESVKAGTVLLICRALARCDNYSNPFMHVPMANGLFQNLVNALEQGGYDVLPLFLSLNPSTNCPFRRFVPKLPELVMDYSQSAAISQETIRQEYAKLGNKGILRIVKTIAFDDMSPENRNNWMNLAEKRRYYGIWLIPSFINHSCLPNASRINVGDVMSIHATKDINEGEEITIPYFNVLLPYHVRQAACREWGFSCLCERCQIERNVVSLDGPKRIHEEFQSLCCDSKTNPGSGESSIDIQAMCRLCDELHVYLESPEGILKQHSMLIRSSFTVPYLARLRLSMEECARLHYDENTCRTFFKNLRTLLEDMATTCPGDTRRVILAWLNLETYRKIVTTYSEYDGCYERMLKLERACTSVYGCQKRKIVKAILSKISEKSIF